MKWYHYGLLFLIVSNIFILPPKPVEASAGYTTLNLTTVDDFYIRNTVGVYTLQNTTGIRAGPSAAGNIERGYLEFNISTIPVGATIIGFGLTFNTTGFNAPNTYKFTNVTTRHNGLTNQQIYNNLTLGATLLTGVNTSGIGVERFYLGQNQDADCQALENLVSGGRDWFVVGFVGLDEAGANKFWQIASLESLMTLKPTFFVEYYTSTPSRYQFTDTYYENGTHYVPPVNVSVSGSGYTDLFNTSGGATHYYLPEPELFYWDIGGGYTRKIYSIGAENITVTMPESTFYAYEFTIKDYTGKLGLGNASLEARRPINGTYTVVERNRILQPNPCALNLVYGVTYRLYVRFANGSVYYWGEFTALSDLTTTIVTRSVQFSDQAQVLFNDIHVDVTRSADGGTITVDYLDDLNHTTWANITIRVRNGAIAHTETRNNSSYTYNWGAANATLGYVVTVNGLHTDYGVWGRSFILDPNLDFPDAPSLNGIFGDVSSDLIPWVLVLVTMLVFFGRQFWAMGLVAGMFMATTLSYIGWASWDAGILAFGWLIAIGSGAKYFMEGHS